MSQSFQLTVSFIAIAHLAIAIQAIHQFRA
jgi:hypothetical protein